MYWVGSSAGVSEAMKSLGTIIGELLNQFYQKKLLNLPLVLFECPVESNGSSRVQFDPVNLARSADFMSLWKRSTKPFDWGR